MSIIESKFEIGSEVWKRFGPGSQQQRGYAWESGRSSPTVGATPSAT
ncbi:hypothetical protein GA0061099_1004447 [Bradyrhizobium yuanmingense]|uniref:Uncharacterized protein n=1 Tax=Bradyrhizobium yuanmingense TaxID=108015 RepID=A0A1C3VRJ0_9BRAD|nr:hypothetical protein IQ15_02206 [Bradyrhizobium yuanmingense]SCB30319.1 hypothetical protein GA0061099_1004447 [Bradyrhizobium yuanmingense]